MASFSACWSDDLAANPGSNMADPAIDGRAAVDLLEQPALVEDLEVAPDGHVRHAELADEVGDADGAVLADAVEDERLALAREHQADPRHVDLDRVTMDTRRSPLLIERLPPQPTESQRIPTTKPQKPLRCLDIDGCG